jgi:hypothetical protein
MTPITNTQLLSRVAILTMLVTLCASGCASTQLLDGEDEAQVVLDRLNERRDSIQSAVYRVRWKAVGTEPHAEFILEIAYRAPEQFRLVATGPFGLPAFTAVVIGDDFTFVNHRDGRFITDDIANLIDYEFPVAEFFEGPWRDLFAGGWGGSHEVETLTRRDGSNQFSARSEDTEWNLTWNRGRQGPARLTALVDSDESTLQADVWFNDHNPKKPPFWRIDRLVLKGMAGKGEHRWNLIKQEYNIPVPDRFFLPLTPPPEWERPRN